MTDGSQSPETNESVPESREGPVMVMAVVVLFAIVLMAGISAMTLYTALYPPDFQKRAEEEAAQRQGQPAAVETDADDVKDDGPATADSEPAK